MFLFSVSTTWRWANSRVTGNLRRYNIIVISIAKFYALQLFSVFNASPLKAGESSVTGGFLEYRDSNEIISFSLLYTWICFRTNCIVAGDPSIVNIPNHNYRTTHSRKENACLLLTSNGVFYTDAAFDSFPVENYRSKLGCARALIDTYVH